MKKILIIGFVLFLAFTVSACSNGGSNNQTDGTTAPSQETTAPTDETPTPDSIISITVPANVIEQGVGNWGVKSGDDLTDLIAKEEWTDANWESDGSLTIKLTQALQAEETAFYSDFSQTLLDEITSETSPLYVPYVTGSEVNVDFTDVTFTVNKDAYLNSTTKNWISLWTYAVYIMSLYQVYSDVPSYGGSVTFADNATGDILHQFSWPDDDAVFVVATLTNAQLQDSSGSSSSDNATTPAKPASTTYNSGMYRIGTDMPAGEYVIIGSGYLEVSSDSSGSFDSIITNDNYKGRTIIAVTDGQYLTFKGTAYKPEDAPAPDTTYGVLREGMYKVGRDFPAGEYKIVPTSDIRGYYEVCKDATGDFGSIISNSNFDTTKYLTVKDGQYIKLSRCELQLN